VRRGASRTGARYTFRFETRSGRPEKSASAANTVADLESTVFDRVGKQSTADFGVAARSVTHLQKWL